MIMMSCKMHESNAYHFRPDLKHGNVTICKHFNFNECYDQGRAECKRPDGVKKHICSFVKRSSGKTCGGAHMKGEHDIVKHGN